MSLKKLLTAFEVYENMPISVNDVRDWIIEHSSQDEINIYLTDTDPKILNGAIAKYTRSSAVYGEPVCGSIIEISKYHNQCYRRFVVCKELIHIMDHEKAATKTDAEIEQLISQLAFADTSNQKEQLKKDYLADKSAEFKALAVLAPEQIINDLRVPYENGIKTDRDIAVFLQIPEVYISLLFSTNFEKLRKCWQ